ncbi:MAG: DEAD/DEAH box helicase [Bacillus sp. (in: firmicutes)]
MVFAGYPQTVANSFWTKEAIYIVDSYSSPTVPLQEKLFGKSLLLTELIDYQLASDQEKGNIRYITAIEYKNGRPQCNRCGTKRLDDFHSHPCARCRKNCQYCRNCIMMGKCCACTRLVVWCGPDVIFQAQENPLQWQGQLSPAQLAASERVTKAIEDKEECLVWAVCGAGKTEVLFAGIAAALQKGERVCIATPRTDVVLELAPRMRKAFPHTVMAALYGGSEEKEVCAQLIISTTHQLFRYEKAFDAIIIDEVDAFPYAMDESLQYAASKAVKDQAATIYLTATPSVQMRRRAAAQKISHVMIPARYHRRSIPVPRLRWTGNWRKSFSSDRIPAPILDWYKSKLLNKTPYLLFFPNIDLMIRLLPLFHSHDPDVEAVHAEDSDRKEKVASLRSGCRLGLLTTTILERGVTIPRLHVAVVGAEEDIFTESALVQIAGRVGRSKEDTVGDIVFFHFGKSTAMIKAVRQINLMNQLARERGLIDD